MLQFLKVENLALIDSVEMECEAGFTAVTGETGAGKSLLMGALALLSGQRADRSMIRDEAEFCEVQAVLFFSDPRRVNEALERQGLEPLENGEMILIRRMQAGGGQRIQINGTVSTLTQLAGVGEAWLELHGPDAPLALFHEAEQIDLLDAFAGNGALRQEFEGIFSRWTDTRKRIEAVEGTAVLSEDEMSFLQSQIDEIRSLSLSEAWVEKLETDFRRVSHAREIDGFFESIEEALTGENGVPERLSEVYRYALKLQELVPEKVSSQVNRLDALLIELSDFVTDLNGLRSILEVDPYEIEEVEENMKRWMGIRRKHGASVETVLAKCAEMEERIAAQGDLEGTLGRLREEEQKLRVEVEEVGRKLTEKRKTEAKPLADKVTDLLKRLGFKRPTFRVDVETTERWSKRGTSVCEYLFSGTAGQGALPLAKVASSGEIARVTLALKTVLAAVDRTAVLVFDEIDANVGGEVGREIGREMVRLSKENQVFTITHLPQVAALADGHFVVRKDQSENDSLVHLEDLSANQDERIDEIARMLGDRRSKTARSHAIEMLGGA